MLARDYIANASPAYLTLYGGCGIFNIAPKYYTVLLKHSTGSQHP